MGEGNLADPIEIDGTVLPARTSDVSLTGVGIRLDASALLPVGERVELHLDSGDASVTIPARIAKQDGAGVGLEYEPLTLAQEAALVQCTFANPRIWEGWRDAHTRDALLESATGMLAMAARGYAGALKDIFERLRMHRHATANA
jgi:cellulose synthase (UDP-forming)